MIDDGKFDDLLSLDPRKNFKIGNLCLENGPKNITIVTDYEGLEIDNSQVWGEIQKVVKPRGGNIVGNLDGFGCRFEIYNDSFHIGTILNPTTLKIFSKSDQWQHAAFDKSSGCLVLGADKSYARREDTILETWDGITHWNGKVRIFDQIAFLPPPAATDIKPDEGSDSNIVVNPQGGTAHFAHGVNVYGSINFSSRSNVTADNVFSTPDPTEGVIQAQFSVTPSENVHIAIPGVNVGPNCFLGMGEDGMDKGGQLAWIDMVAFVEGIVADLIADAGFIETLKSALGLPPTTPGGGIIYN
jgi:hypothetical protein